MAAGTAAALVPIRSITRRVAHSDPGSLAATVKTHPRLEVGVGYETVRYMPDDQEEAGSMCVRLLTHLKGIQSGKMQDTFGWCHVISEEDGTKVTIEPPSEGNGTKGGDRTVDQLD